MLNRSRSDGRNKRTWNRAARSPGWTSTAAGSTKEGSNVSLPPTDPEVLEAKAQADTERAAKQAQSEKQVRDSAKEKKAKGKYRAVLAAGGTHDEAFAAASPIAPHLLEEDYIRAASGGRRRRK